MAEYSNSEFIHKLKRLQNSQSAIQSLSMWCLKHHEHYKSIIIIWSNAIRKVKIERRLSLFYLANHVIQYSKKKNYKFVNRWKTPIQEAIPYVQDEKIQLKISRVINIWEERGIYDVSYLADLIDLLTTPIQKLKLTNPVQNIQMHAIKAKIRNFAKLFQINDSKMKNLTETILPFTDNETIQHMLKDQTQSHELFNNSMSIIESSIKCLKRDTHINVPPPSASFVSIVDLNIHNINGNTVLNSDKCSMNSSMINTINDTDMAVLATTPDKYTTVQELNDPASVSFPAIENQNQQSLTNQFPYDVPSLPPPDETLAYFAFPNQKKMNNNNNVPDVTYQWKQPSRPWSNDEQNFNKNQWNIKQSDQRKHPYQWAQDQSISNFVHNHPHSLWPQYVQQIQSKEDFRPKWERGINIWGSRDPRNFIPHSRPSGTGNQDHVLESGVSLCK